MRRGRTLPAPARQRGDPQSSSSACQGGSDRIGRHLRARDQRIEIDRIVRDRREQRLLHHVVAGVIVRGGVGCLARADAGGSIVQHILRGLDQLAPSRISLCAGLVENGEWIDPGIANTSRPCSPARRAVMSEPDDSVASTTSTPRASPLTAVDCGAENFP